MARSQRAGGGSRDNDGTGDADRILDAALIRIADGGWRRLSLAAVAAEAKLPIGRLYRLFPSRVALLCGLFRRVDEAVLAVVPDLDDSERPRDRLFDVLMRRFDALSPYKSALAVLRRELPTDPPAALAAGAALLRSMRWMVEAAGIPTGGIGGAVAVKLTAVAYVAAARTWIADDSADLAPTMAVLDQRLRGFERWLGPLRPRAA